MRVRIHVSPFGNLFMTEIARLLQAGFDDLGVETVRVPRQLPVSEPGWCNVVVAPHEFFPLFEDVTEAECLEAAARSVLVSVEQPGTSWFGIGSSYSRVARAVFDINGSAVDELRADGVEAHWLRLGYHATWDRWNGAHAAPRPVDAVYMGSLTARREEGLAELGAVLAARRSRLLIHDGLVPVTEEDANFVGGEAKFELLSRSKVIVNFHRSCVPYFEWHRHLAALANGCVVLTEPSEAYEPLRPFEHFWVAEAEELPNHLDLLLASDDLRRRVTDAAYELVRSQLLFTDLLRPLLPAFEAAVTTGRSPSRRVARRIRTSPGYRDRKRRPGGPLLPPAPEIPRSSPVERALKRALISQQALLRRVDELTCRVDHGTDQVVETFRTPAYDAARPEISVVVPLHDYEDYVAGALESALHSRGVSLEVIVVDDHSTDDSRAVVEDVMRRNPHAAILFMALTVNEGVSHVRNRALEEARGRYVFLLDADNRVYPDALAKLLEALSPGDAAFAYGILETFGDERRLVSCYPWDPSRLVRGNYIDAMALIRRDVLTEIGGFAVDMQSIGWEDYELWLRFADRGLRGELVPEIVGRYRFHRASRTSIVNLDVEAIFEELQGRYPDLPWPVRPGEPARSNGFTGDLDRVPEGSVGGDLEPAGHRPGDRSATGSEVGP